MKTQREKFEDWFKSKWRKHALTLNYDLTYVDDIVQDYWIAWQAAIESLAVNLSEIDGVTDDSGRTRADVVYRSDVEQVLSKAGIKYE